MAANRTRSLVYLMLALWVAAPLAGFLHTAHAHRYCVEHRTYEESDTESAEAARAVAETSAGVEAAGEVADAPSGGHQACWVHATLRAPQSPPRPALLGLAAHWVQLASRLVDRAAPPPVSPLVRAPKSSPPARGS